MATTLAALLSSGRAFVGDGPADNYVRLENLNNADLGNVLNGSQKTFNLTNYPLPPGGLVSVIADGAAVTPSAVDEPHGQFTLAAGPTQTLVSSYYYYYFSDATWTEFVTSALEILGLSANGPTLDVPQVPEGLLAALKMYCCYGFAMRLASQTGTWYNQKLQEREEARDSISTKWLKIAAAYKKDADTMRDDYYKGTGTQNRPAFRILEHEPTNFTPNR